MDSISQGINENHNSLDSFGTQEMLINDYVLKAVAAKSGIYGNTKTEAVYFQYRLDHTKQAYDISKNKYVIHFV